MDLGSKTMHPKIQDSLVPLSIPNSQVPLYTHKYVGYFSQIGYYFGVINLMPKMQPLLQFSADFNQTCNGYHLDNILSIYIH